jgi:glycosyltransferase involved in cell wall biosynthesis
MKDRPLVSVIVIFFNAEEFIQEAVESIFSQTYDGWELLLVDDNDYVSCYPGKVSYLEHPGHKNLGGSESRNLGLHHTRGDYIAFLDADDVWHAPKLEQQIAIMESQPEVGILY